MKIKSFLLLLFLLLLLSSFIVYAENLNEQVKCIFLNSLINKTCSSEKGICKGTKSCIANVTGYKGEKIDWVSKCGNITTIIDGKDDKIEFNCVLEVREQIKCIFKNSNSQQYCYSEKINCKGNKTCVINLIGKKGEKMNWKSTCDGSFTTVIEGMNDKIEFRCGMEQVRCLFKNSLSPKICYSEKGRCTGNRSCIANVYGKFGEKIYWKSDCFGEPTTLIDGNDERAHFQCIEHVPKRNLRNIN